MTNPTQAPHADQEEDALRRHILIRAAAINGAILARLATVSDDLDAGRNLAALGGLDGIEREIATLRSFLLLVP